MTIREIINIVKQRKNVEIQDIFPFVIENVEDGKLRYTAVVGSFYSNKIAGPVIHPNIGVFYLVVYSNETAHLEYGSWDNLDGTYNFNLVDILNEHEEKFNNDIEEIVHEHEDDHR